MLHSSHTVDTLGPTFGTPGLSRTTCNARCVFVFYGTWRGCGNLTSTANPTSIFAATGLATAGRAAAIRRTAAVAAAATVAASAAAQTPSDAWVRRCCCRRWCLS